MDKVGFDINYKITDNTIVLNIVCDCAEAEFAYYLYKDNVKFSQKWYSKDKHAEFIVISSGIYKGIGFVKVGDVVMHKQTPEFECNIIGQVSQPIKLSIFGSCTSRDILEYGKKGEFQLGAYVARQSIISSLSKPIDFNFDDCKIKSHFQKRQIINDFQKNTFDILREAKSDYLIIDLIDERFNLAEYMGSVVTASNELVSSGILDNRFKKTKVRKIKNWKIYKLKKQLKGVSYIFKGRLLEDYIKEFCNNITEIFEENNIIIHRAVLVDYYIDKEGNVVQFPMHYLLYNKIINSKLNYMYDYFQKFLPKAFFIDECKNYYADENHKWGLAPMHYQKEYYTNILYLLKKYVK